MCPSDEREGWRGSVEPVPARVRDPVDETPGRVQDLEPCRDIGVVFRIRRLSGGRRQNERQIVDSGR